MKSGRWRMAVLLILMFFLQGCKQIDINVEEKIKAPDINASPAQGTWKISRFIPIGDNLSSENEKKYVGKSAAFDRDIVVLGEDVCISPEYKIKNVSADEYFAYRFKISSGKVGISSDQVSVISITSRAQPFSELIKVSDNKMLAYVNQGFLDLYKISDKVDSKIKQYGINQSTSKGEFSVAKEDTLLRSGVLLGLRLEQSGNSKDTEISYRTLWIASRNKELKPVFEMKQLFVPRKNGFWEVGYRRDLSSKPPVSTLYAHLIYDIGNDYGTETEKNILQEYGQRKILFVGNDYIGTEYEYGDEGSSARISSYQVLPMDNVSYRKGINISDIAGENGSDALRRSAESFMLSQDKNTAESLEKIPDESNFTLVRRNGHWVMKGRLNYINSNSGLDHEDFNIYLTPEKLIINYDTLYLPWNEVKAKEPEALDVYTSPNKDVALIITKNNIDVYMMKNGSLSNKPAGRIKLAQGEEVVMAEWARGDYMEKWDSVIRGRASQISNKTK